MEPAHESALPSVKMAETTAAPMSAHTEATRSGASAPLAIPGLTGAVDRHRPVLDLPSHDPFAAVRSPVTNAGSGVPDVATNRLEVLRRTSARTAPFALTAPSAASTIVRRTPEQLTSKKILAGLRNIPIIEEKLGQQLAQGPDALEHVKRALKAFDKHLALKKSDAFINEAIRIATIIDATAAELARSITDPTLKPQIAKELIAAYRPELTQQLGSAKKVDRNAQTDKALDLATTIVGDDPVTLYMTGKVLLADAAWRVRDMAAAAETVTPIQMMGILRSRFEMEIGSHTQAEVSQGARGSDDITQTDADGVESIGSGGFDLGDLIGEISPTFYLDVVPLKTTEKERAKPAKWGSGGLVMNGKATIKLDALARAVEAADLAATTLTPEALAAEQVKSGTALNAKQSEHFARLRSEEAGDAANYEGRGQSPRDFLVEKFASRYGLSAPKAGSLIDEVLRALETVPLTLTSKLDNLFKEREDKRAEPLYGSAYKSEPALMQQKVDLSEMIGKPDGGNEAMSIGRPDANFAKTRGENYLRWRRDKDERETGYHGLSADDLPVFGAVNPNFMDTMGGNANLAEFDPAQGKYVGTTFGANYYGDVHLLLKDSVRRRSTLIARGIKAVTGRRIERADLTFLLADMCRLFMYDYVDAMVAGLKKPDTVVLTNMDAEVHVYGGLDVATDVEAFYLSPAAFAANDGAAARCKQFAADKNIEVRSVGTMPADYDITRKQGASGGIDLKSLLTDL